MISVRTTAMVILCAAFAALAEPPAVQAQSRNQPYVTFGDWIVEFVPAERQREIPAHCQVTKVFDQEVALRIVSGVKLHAIDFMGLNYLTSDRKGYEVEYFFDQPSRNVLPRHAVTSPIKDSEGTDWMRIQESNDEPGSADDMMKARLFTIRAPNANDRQWQYPLEDSSQALNALFDCRDEKVLGQPRRAPAPTAQLPTPPQQLIHPVPLPPLPPVAQLRQVPLPPVRIDNSDLCNNYAATMVSNTQRALQAKCAGWSAENSNRDGNFDWCRNKPRSEVEKALATWNRRLKGCLATAGNRAPAQGAAQANLGRYPVCYSFAKYAERWDRTAKQLGCRIRTGKNEAAYYQWCMSTDDASFRASNVFASGHKAGREKECTAQLRRPVHF